MVVSPSATVCCLAPPHGDGVSADKRRFLRATDEWGNPLQASEAALGAVGLVGPMTPHHMPGCQPPTGRIGADVLGNDGPGQRQPRLLHRGACPTPRVDHIVQRVVSDKQPSPRRRIGRCTARARKIVTGVPSLGLRLPFFVLPYWYGHRVH